MGPVGDQLRGGYSMSDSFILPEGIKLAMTDEGLVIENEGDIVLHGQIDGGIHALTSHNGNIILNNDFVLHRVDAPNGAVEIHGKIEADRIEAASVSADGTGFTVRVVQASESIAIGETTAHAEVLIAPAVNLSSAAVGRVTVVESHNDLNATKVKGCLSLADLEELFDGSEGFIRGWEITPLHKSSSHKATQKSKPKTKAKAAPAKRAKAPEPPAEEAVPDEAPAAQAAPPPEPVVQEAAPPEPEVVTAEVEEEPDETAAPLISMPNADNGDGRAEQVEQLFDLFDDSDEDTDGDPALDGRISDAVSELVGYYADVELPPVVQRLAQLVAERDYKTVRDEVDDIWNKLLRYHKQKKLRPKPSLTTTFNTIHAIVREM
jgi:hypothetical protein